MRTCAIAVVGLGLMGSAALYALARRGADVLGFDPLNPGAARGSSHGSCRAYRRFNFESDAYTDLSEQAYAGWRALESATGRSVLRTCAVLEAGPAGSKMIKASRAAAGKAGPITGPTTGAEANAAFPAFNLPADWDVVVQDSGGILMAEAALRAFREGAEGLVIPKAARVQARSFGICVRAGDEEVIAEQVIVAAGPWIGQFIPALKPHLTITRQAVGWFKPLRPQTVGFGDLPIFIVEGPRGLVYGFPDFEGRGVKAAQHDLGPVVGPDAWEPPASDEELEVVSATLCDFVPGASGPIVDREICLYTNTLAADVQNDQGQGDDGKEFIIDRLPQDPRIIVASPCSGHGAKFASAIGEMLADLALDSQLKAPAAFRLDRFSSFAPVDLALA